MKKIIMMLVLLLAGLGVGGGAAYGTLIVTGGGGGNAHGDAAAPEGDPVFVPAGSILAPLVFEDGRLSGYVKFEVELQVVEDKGDFVTARLPLFKHSINMRTFRTPLASGPDGLLPDIEGFRRVAQEAADEALGKDVVRRVAVSQAEPA